MVSVSNGFRFGKDVVQIRKWSSGPWSAVGFGNKGDRRKSESRRVRESKSGTIGHDAFLTFRLLDFSTFHWKGCP